MTFHDKNSILKRLVKNVNFYLSPFPSKQEQQSRNLPHPFCVSEKLFIAEDRFLLIWLTQEVFKLCLCK